VAAETRARKLTMSELVELVITLEFYEIGNKGKILPAEVTELSAFLKKHIARWAGDAGAL